MRLLVVLSLSLAACGNGGSSKPSDAGVDGNDAISDAMSDAPSDGGQTSNFHDPTCMAEWCWFHPLPQGHDLNAIWAASTSDVWAVTMYGTLLHYDGMAWKQYGAFGLAGNSGTTESWKLRGTSSDLWLSTLNDTTGTVWHWDGSAWSVTNLGILGVFGLVDTTAWVVGVTSREWNGSQWLERPGLQVTPLAVGGNGGTVVAVMSDGSIAKLIGGSWGVSAPGWTSGSPGRDAVVIDSTHVVVGRDDSVAFWDNGTWTFRTTPSAGRWDRISATSLNDVWITSKTGTAVRQRLHWDGMTWTSHDDPAGGRPNGLYQLASGELFVAGADSQARAWTGSAWTGLMTASNAIVASWGTAANDLWIVTQETAAEVHTRHWDGSAWTDVPFSFPGTLQVGGMWGSAPNNYWLGGVRVISASSYQRLLWHWDGSQWSELSQGTAGFLGDTPDFFHSIWGSGPDDVYAVSSNVTLHRDATGWSAHPTLPAGSPFPPNHPRSNSMVFGTSANDVYFIHGADLWHFNGMAWTMTTAPSLLTGGWANSPTDIWLAGNSSLIHYDGMFFVQSSATGPGHPFGTASEMWTFGDPVGQNGMKKWTGGFAVTPTSMTRFFDGPFSGWMTSDGHIWVQSSNGLLVH